MAFEHLKAGVASLLEEIEKSPDNVQILHDQLRAKISEMRSLGLPVPDHLLRLEDQIEQQEADDMFDNMPV